jgi:hypothetical protein
MLMTDTIRTQVDTAMKSKELNKSQLGQLANIERSNVSRMLSERHNITPAWQRLLTALDLELIAVPKDKLDDVKRILETQ